MTIKNQAAIVGVGSTPYYRRGQSWPQTMVEMACKATLTALEDAGLTVDDLDGFAYYSGGFDTALIAQILGVPEVKDFLAPSGLAGPGQMSGLLARRHMYQYGTKREHFAEVVISTRENAVRRPTSIMQKPL